MKMRTFFMLLGISATMLFGCKKDADISEEQKERYIKFYGTSAEGSDMVMMSDGGYLLLGTAQGNGNKDFFLVKTDANGNQIWAKSFDSDTGSYDDIASALVSLNNGNFAIVGTTEDEYGSTLFILIDGSGNVIEKKRFHSPNLDEPERCFDVIQYNDGRLVLCGQRQEVAAISGFLRVIDPLDGYSEKLYMQPLVNEFQVYNVSFRALVSFNDELVISGVTNFGGLDIRNTDNIFRLRTSLTEVFDLSDFIYTGGTSDDGANDILGDGINMIISGFQSDGSVRKIFVGNYDYTIKNASVPKWEYRANSSTESTSHKIIKSRNGYLLAGFIENSSHGRQLYMAELSATDGSILWEQNYGYTEFDEAHSVVQTQDGGYALFGTSSDERGNMVMCLIKTDANGNVR